MTRHLLNGFFLFASLVCTAPSFGDIVIDFDDLTLGNSAAIPENYGSNPLFNVSYRELDSFGTGTVVANNLSFWATGYGDLENVVWGSSNNRTRVAEIRFDSTTANTIRLNSFETADWDGRADSQTFRVYDENFSQLFELTNFDVSHITRDTITPNVSSNTLILQWDFPWAVAVDNISITAVPEPSSLALLGVCSACFILQRRRIIRANASSGQSGAYC